MSDFENQNGWESDWQEVIGGEIVKPEQGCGVISSGSSLYFSKAGKRQLVSWDLDTSWVDFVQFYIQIGGESAACNKPDSREEGVLLQYSNNGGIQWHLLAEMYFSDFSKPRFVYLELPAAAKTPCTRFRWWQPVFSGEGYDQWAVDDIIILSEKQKQVIPIVNPTLPQLNIGCANQFSSAAPVLLQYSHDAGMSWFLVKEGCYPASAGKGCEGNSRELSEPTMYHTGDFEEWTRITIVIPRSLASSKTRFRWIQESSSQKNVPPFGLDGVYISEPCPSYCSGHGDCVSGVCFCDLGYTATQGTCVSNVPNHSEMFDRFEGKLSPLWYKITGGQVGTGCGTLNDGKSLYFNGPGKREARTIPLDTRNIRLVQFYIQIGSKTSGITCIKPRARNEGKLLKAVQVTGFMSFNSGLVVQYSNDNGILWHLLRELDFMSFLEPQIISIDLPREAKTPATAFRWWQPQHGKLLLTPPFPVALRTYGKHSAQWALDDVLIGMNDSSQTGFQDKFDGSIDLQASWYRIQGGQVGIDCLSMDTALIFTENIGKPRYAETWDFHVSASTFLQFEMSMGCSKPFSDAHSVQLQYSLNNGRDWHLVTEECVPPTIGCLHYAESSVYTSERFQNWKRITVYLPLSTMSQASGTNTEAELPWGFRFQSQKPFRDSSAGTSCPELREIPASPRVSHPFRLFPRSEWQEKPESKTPDSARELGDTCLKGRVRYLQTMFSPLVGGFSRKEHPILGVRTKCLQEGTRTWRRALQSERGVKRNALLLSRVRVEPSVLSLVRSPRTRFRWIQSNYTVGADTWAIDNVVLASGCPWLCSGRGICDAGHCVCDRGFGGAYCVPIVPLPSILKDDFNGNLHPDLWPEVYGAERGNLNGETIKSGTSLIFKGEGLRMLISRDLDCTNTMYVQFSLRFIAKGTPERSHSILLQFSINGGITWHLMDEFYFPQTTNILFINVPLPYTAQTNATRFRLWQPYNNGKKEEIWIVDDFIIDGNNLNNPVMLLDTFDFGPREDNWFFYPGGNIGLYCPYSSKGAPEEDSAMVFVSNEVGEHSITTRDLDVNENTIIQFEINVGCSTDSSCTDPVRLEFSRDFGATWHLLLPLCYHGSNHVSSLCSTEHHPSSTYYAGTTQGWRREVVHFGKLHLCGESTQREDGSPQNNLVTWAIDNVYIGPQCEEMCNGHGGCINGTKCICDPGYSGPTCKISTKNPDFLKDDFEGQLESDRFLLMSGGKPSRKCGILSSGNNLFFNEDGLRMLMTRDLDLSHARFVQFFMRLGCGKGVPDPRSQPVLLQYSLNGGLSWSLLQEFLFSNSSNVGRYIALEIPLKARSASTRLRWWQPSENGHFYSPWVIDQILIGGNISGNTVLEDDFTSLDSRKWLLHPGGTKMPVCGSSGDALVFIEKASTRYVVTTDVAVNEDSFLQIDFAASCSVTDSCYEGRRVQMGICGTSDKSECKTEVRVSQTVVAFLEMEVMESSRCGMKKNGMDKIDMRPCKHKGKQQKNLKTRITFPVPAIELEYSVDLGLSWHPLIRDCLPTNVECSRFHLQRILVSDTFNKWTRITLPLPPYT
ncbi:hypothetical protein GH733_013200, partial [Mirounga leonina]